MAVRKSGKDKAVMPAGALQRQPSHAAGFFPFHANMYLLPVGLPILEQGKLMNLQSPQYSILWGMHYPT